MKIKVSLSIIDKDEDYEINYSTESSSQILAWLIHDSIKASGFPAKIVLKELLEHHANFEELPDNVIWNTEKKK